jgi:hypothetical protein
MAGLERPGMEKKVIRPQFRGLFAGLREGRWLRRQQRAFEREAEPIQRRITQAEADIRLAQNPNALASAINAASSDVAAAHELQPPVDPGHAGAPWHNVELGRASYRLEHLKGLTTNLPRITAELDRLKAEREAIRRKHFGE